MKIQYEFTVANMADVMRRAAKRRKLWLTWRWRRRATESALLGAVLYLIIEGPVANRVAGAALFFVISYYALWLIRSQSLDASYMHFFRERAGGDGPFVFELEITSEALIAKQLGETHSRKWCSVTKITEAKGGIEIDTRSGLVFVRDTGFKSSAERSEFLDLARRFLDESRIKSS
jgi:hypothetical protein